ncbi:permease-like cell division protein FtsX [Actinomadura rubrisoli]|uniref:FtsX extracellular domain-containing protein n=1 Tax=Actinomadura rubrisoli TaxID=2530368 RepID=A0A4R5B1F5_9ACTN|nr:permease-like cell division protein FtsX [Actinomadura rubrisoli]TDD79431.1 hypothetical protein E1298_27775 [Actinomadura rubrisoli]
MNATEERLRDALKTVGETLAAEDVPPPRFAGRRRAMFSRPVLVAAAVAASAVVAVGGVTAGAVFTSGEKARPLSPAREAKVAVFLCVRTSSNPSCEKRDATAQQREAVKNLLERLPQVRKVEYESKRDAYERFKERFGKDERFLRLQPGDVPDSMRVTLRAGAKPKTVMMAVLGTPGVDQVLIEKR